MKFFTDTAWNTKDNVTTDQPGCYVGIAIGPESDEASVRVGDRLLQAGRPLAIPTRDTYRITRSRVPANTIAQIAQLQLVLFEDYSELAAYDARAPKVYSNKAIVPDATPVRVVVAPSCGRRRAQFLITATGADLSSWSYKVKGIRYSAAKASLVEYPIKVQATGNLLDPTDHTLVFYVEDEPYDAYAIDIASASAPGTFYVDVEMSGDE